MPGRRSVRLSSSASTLMRPVTISQDVNDRALAAASALLGWPQATPASGTADLGKAAAGCLGGGSSRLTAGGSHRSQVVLDDRRGGAFEHRYRRRHGSCTACASIASTARRYS